MGAAAEKITRYTYSDYLCWDDKERWEIIDGEAYSMSPAPLIKHQNIAGNLYVKLKTHRKNPCYTGIAPTDVVFDEENVVQPDVFLVCDKTKITPQNIRGVHDLIIEVISSSTELRDRRDKKNLYERFGVREYIIVFPEREYVERYVLKNKKYRSPEIFNWDETLRLTTVKIDIHLREIFEKEQ